MESRIDIDVAVGGEAHSGDGAAADVQTPGFADRHTQSRQLCRLPPMTGVACL